MTTASARDLLITNRKPRRTSPEIKFLAWHVIPRQVARDRCVVMSIATMAGSRQTTLKGLLPPVRVGVVGTAGRSEDGKKMTSELFKRMIDKTVDVITNVFKLDVGRVRLVSGGAAWAGECICVHYMQWLKVMTCALLLRQRSWRVRYESRYAPKANHCITPRRVKALFKFANKRT